MAKSWSITRFNNKALLLLARQKNDEAFSSIVKQIIKIRYRDMNLNLYNLTKLAYEKEGLECQALAEVIVEKSRDEDGIIKTLGFDKAVNYLSINYLMTASKESRNEYIKAKSMEKVHQIFEEIESIPDIRGELLKKIEMDNEENNKVRRMVR